MISAYEDALKVLGSPDRKSPMAEVLADNIIALASDGEVDVIQLRKKALGPTTVQI